MIYFTDGSRATIPPNSRVKLEARSSSVALRVLSGSVDLNAGGRLASQLDPAGPSGGGEVCRCPSFWSARPPTTPPVKTLQPPPPRSASLPTGARMR